MKFKIGFRIMKKHIALLVLLGLMPCHITAQEQNGQQEQSALSQYQREKVTVPYKVKNKVTKARRVATRQGNKELKKEKFSQAVSAYRNAMTADSNYAKAQFNRAVAHGKLHQNDTALNYYDRVCKNSSATIEQRVKAHYNAGNIHLRQALAARDTGGYDATSLKKAIEEYKAALRLDSKNNDAKHNLSLAKQLLRPEQQSGGGGGGQDRISNRIRINNNSNSSKTSNNNSNSSNNRKTKSSKSKVDVRLNKC